MKRMMVSMALVAIIAAMCAGPVWAQAEWTIMVYMNGDNDLESKIIGDLNEMEQATVSSSINVIVQIDRAVGYDATNGDWTTCRRYKVVKDNNTAIIGSTLIEDLGLPGGKDVDMGSPQTLADFAKWTIEKYPAKKYSLIMSDHGSGWYKGGGQDGLKGFSSDNSSGNTIDVTNGEFGNAMRQITDYLKQVTNDPNRKLDHIAWDACLMGMWEVLDIAKDYANYANVSEQVMVYPPGYDYNNFLASVSATPTMDARYLGIHLLGVNTDGQHTKSLIDLSKIDALTSKIDKFAQELQASRASYGGVITTALNNTLKFYYTTHIDLGDFADKIYNSNVPASLKTAAAECSVAVKNARATAPMNSAAHANAHGIAIYHNGSEAFHGSYPLLPIAGKTCWDEYLQNQPAHAGLWIFPTSPQNGDIVFGGTFIKIFATDPDGIKKIEYYVDGVLQATSYQTPYYYEVKWPSKAVECKIVAKAYDNLNNTNAATLVIKKPQGADSYYNKLNVGGTAYVIDPASGATVAFTLSEIYVADGVRKARISISNQPTINDAQAGKMYKVGGLFIYPATLFIGSETYSEIMIAPYQYPSVDILYPAPGQSVGTTVVRVATNYSGKNVPWNGIGNPPVNADLLKTLTFNGSAGQTGEAYTWVPGGSAGSRTMTVNLTDKLGTVVSKSVTINYDPAIPLYAYYGPYGDYYKELRIRGFTAGGDPCAEIYLCYRPGYTTCDGGDFSHHLPCYNLEQEINQYAYVIANYTSMWSTPPGVQVYVVDKNQYNSGSFGSSFGYGTITYKQLYDAVAARLGRDSQGKYRVWASASAATRSPLDAIADASPPPVNITAPANGSYINTTAVNVTGTASDDYALSKVEVSVNGGAYALATGTTSWSKSVTLTANQVNTITAKATDSQGKTTITSISVTCDLTPATITISSPAVNGTVYCSKIPVIGTAADNAGVSKVEARANYGTWRLAAWTPGSSTMWRCDLVLASGSNAIEARVTDISGNAVTIAQACTYSTSGTPSPISLSAPGAIAEKGCNKHFWRNTDYDLGSYGNYSVSISFTMNVTNYATRSVTIYLDYSYDNINWYNFAAGTANNWYNGNVAAPSGSFVGRYLRVRSDTWCGSSTECTVGYGYTYTNGSYGGLTVSNTCLPSGMDGTPPAVSITMPATVPVKEAATISASASDASGIDRVEFYADAGIVGTDNASPYTCAWTPMITKNYTIMAKAYDMTGNSNTHVITVTATGMAGYWKLDASTGTVAADNSGNENNGTVNSATWVAGQVNNGLSFDGTDDYVTVADAASLRASQYTVSVWIKPNGVPSEEWKGIIGKPGRNFNVWLHNSGMIHHRFHNSSSTNAGAPDTPAGSIVWNVWNHIVITNDGTTAKTYINGVEKASGSAGGAQIADNTTLYIGRNLDGASGNYFKGLIDEACIYNKALSADEVQVLHMQSSLAASWKFDQTSGTTATDISGYNNAGTLTNMDPATDWVTGKYGKALDFDGSNDYVSVGNPASLKITGNQTISMWIKPHGFTARRNPYNKAYGGEGTITVETNGRVNYYYGTYGGNGGTYQGFTMTRACTANVWTHLAIVRDLSSMKLRWYKNGALTNEATALYAAAKASANNVTIGYGYTGYYFDGLIDELRVYNSALSATEITAIFNNTKIDNEPAVDYDDHSELVMTRPANPEVSQLMLCSPNPFTGQTNINFHLAQPAQTTLKVYNLMGQVVKTLVNECLRPGYHSVKWDGRDANGNKVAAGVYLYRMESGDYSKTNKMTVLR